VIDIPALKLVEQDFCQSFNIGQILHFKSLSLAPDITEPGGVVFATDDSHISPVLLFLFVIKITMLTNETELLTKLQRTLA
jgi:hypothetical protein